MSMLNDFMQGPWFVIIILSLIAGGWIFLIVWNIIYGDDEDYKERHRHYNRRYDNHLVSMGGQDHGHYGDLGNAWEYRHDE